MPEYTTPNEPIPERYSPQGTRQLRAQDRNPRGGLIRPCLRRALRAPAPPVESCSWTSPTDN
eukprot:5513042-Pyramimonas_sp.AAC.1